MMNPLCFVTITLHFEIRNSEMYGGNGSVGYSASSFQGVAHPEQADDSFVEAQRRITAKLLSVPVEDVTVITKDAYPGQRYGPALYDCLCPVRKGCKSIWQL